ncbi:MAG TPA: hypothetical protein VI793_07650 [Anaerolineales bacterium]|nr:hypothetical protein [Anaerolineales bacterium]
MERPVTDLAQSTPASRPSAAADMRRLFGSPRVWGATLALIAFTLWLRLRQLGYYAEMGVDQSITLNLALEWVHGGPLPLVSMKSSIGVFNPPLAEYLYALALALHPDVLSVPWVVALVNLAGLLAAGLATTRVFGWRVGWWATLLFCVNPWVVHFSRSVWMQNFAPGFAALLYACVLLYFTYDQRPVYLILAAVFLSATIQVHLTAAVLCLALLIVGARFFRRLKIRPLLLGGVIFLLSFAPFIIYQLRTGLEDWQALQDSLNQSPSETNLAPVLIALDLLQSKGIYATLGSAAERWQALDPWGARVDGLVAVLFGLAVALATWRVTRQAWSSRWRGGWPPQVEAQFIMLIWLFTPILVYLRHSYYLQNYYFTYLWPIPFVLLALLADSTYVWLADLLRPRFSRVAGWAALAAFLPLALIVYQQARLMIIGQALAAAGVVGRQRGMDVQQAIDSARQLMAARPECQLVVMSEGARYDSSRFGLLSEFVDPKRVRFAEAGVGYLLPAPCAVYFLAANNPEAQVWLDANARLLDENTIRTPEETWFFYDLPAAAREAAAGRWRPDSPRGEWEAGIHLLQFDVQGDPHPGHALQLISIWQVVEARSPREIHFGSYLLDQDDRLLAQVDSPGMDSTQWRTGDVFQTAFHLDLPPDLAPGTYRLAAALYLYPDVQRLELADGEGDLLYLQELSIAAP